jgi:type IV pilus assembly protein PilY1
VYWDGELEARRISLADGSLASQIEWSASVQLRQRVAAVRDDRTIYIPSSTDIYGLKEFRWQLLSTNERQLFSGCDAPPARRWQQCMQLSDTSRTQAGGANLVDYLRGQSQFEDKPENSVRLFRKREQVLGAPINAQPVFVGAPAFRYADLNYGEYRDRIATNRSATVYLAANDGMLHSFDAATGRERWAFIPSGVLPELWRVADNAFANNFRYLLDGTPVVGDICPTAPRESCTAEAWRTILVGGLGAAGREYYALDITQADQPKLLWRIAADTEPQLGYAVGKPIITKRRDGKWVVLITSGYNNVAPGAGLGVLFVLDAATGAVLKRIETDVGTSDNPAGLAHLNAWVDNLLDNTAERVYGGDLLGNLWRFDINDTLVGAGSGAVRLASLVRSGVIQPITTRPELSMVRIGNQSLPVVSVGTGRYLGISDGSDKSVQSIYTFRDRLDETGLGDIRQRSSMVQKRLISGAVADARSISNEQVDWLMNDGWFVDLDVQSGSGERVVVDPEQQLGMLSVVSNMPDSNACRPRAESWSYTFNYMNGSYIPSASNTSVARRVTSASMISGARIVRVGNRVVTVLTDDTGTVSVITQSSSMGTTPRARRVAWRELDQ